MHFCAQELIGLLVVMQNINVVIFCIKMQVFRVVNNIL